LDDAERAAIAEQIAIGALRFFMLKYTKPSVIAFDFKDALSFEGETGPYVQYAVVRATNIFRKGGFNPDSFCRDGSASPLPAETGQRPSLQRMRRMRLILEGNFEGSDGSEIWELWLSAAKTSYMVAPVHCHNRACLL